MNILAVSALINAMVRIEAAGLMAAGLKADGAILRVISLFLVLVLGILAKWFVGVGSAYLSDPAKGLDMGPPLALVVRVILSFIFGALTFLAAYNQIRKSTEESWAAWFVAFQSGFTWEALLSDVTRSALRTT